MAGNPHMTPGIHISSSACRLTTVSLRWTLYAYYQSAHSIAVPWRQVFEQERLAKEGDVIANRRPADLERRGQV